MADGLDVFQDGSINKIALSGQRVGDIVAQHLRYEPNVLQRHNQKLELLGKTQFDFLSDGTTAIDWTIPATCKLDWCVFSVDRAR
jgi:hypothetical protein